MNPYQVPRLFWYSGFGSNWTKNDPQKKKKISKCIVRCSLLRSGGFFCRLGINTYVAIFDIKKIFFNCKTVKPLDVDSIRTEFKCWIRILKPMLIHNTVYLLFNTVNDLHYCVVCLLVFTHVFYVFPLLAFLSNSDHISESFETIFWVKKFFDADPGWKKFGSGINIPDPQH